MKISVVISAYNEERHINDCLMSAKKIADEIIFIDNQSTDATAELAKKYTKKIFKKVNDPIMIDKNKNFGFLKASGDWIFSLDADERISDMLASEIKKAVQNTKTMGFKIPYGGLITTSGFSKTDQACFRLIRSMRKLKLMVKFQGSKIQYCIITTRLFLSF